MKRILITAMIVACFFDCGTLSAQPNSPVHPYDGITFDQAGELGFACLQAKHFNPADIERQTTSTGGVAYYVTSSDGMRDMKIKFIPNYGSVVVQYLSPLKPGMQPSTYTYQEFYTCFDNFLSQFRAQPKGTKIADFIGSLTSTSRSAERISQGQNLIPRRTKSQAIEELRELGVTVSYAAYESFLVFKGPSIMDEMSEYRKTVDDYYKVLDLYLDAGMDPNVGLPFAIIGWNDKLFTHLIDRGASVKPHYRKASIIGNKPTYFSPINEAAGRYCDTIGYGKQNIRFVGIKNLFTYLVEHGVDVNEKSTDSTMIPPHDTPLYELVRCNSFEAINYLIEKGAIVNYNGEKETPLVAAYPNYEVMKTLIEHGADVNVVKVEYRFGGGRTEEIRYIPLLALAEKDGRFDIIELLKSHGATGEVPLKLRKKTKKSKG